MATNISDDPEYWRARAEEARARAGEMIDAHTKSLMLGIAESYDKIAKWVEDHVRERGDGKR